MPGHSGEGGSFNRKEVSSGGGHRSHLPTWGWGSRLPLIACTCLVNPTLTQALASCLLFLSWAPLPPRWDSPWRWSLESESSEREGLGQGWGCLAKTPGEVVDAGRQGPGSGKREQRSDLRRSEDRVSCPESPEGGEAEERDGENKEKLAHPLRALFTLQSAWRLTHIHLRIRQGEGNPPTIA